MEANPDLDVNALIYHPIELGDIKTLQAVKVKGESSEATRDALHNLNVLLRDMAMGSVLIPGLPTPPTANPRSERFNQFKEQGNALFRQNKNQEAVKMYTLAAQMAATRPVYENAQYAREELVVALNNRSAAFLQAGDFDHAVVDAEAAIKLKPMLIKSYFRKGKALAGAGRLHEAREAYLLGLEFDPTAEDLLTSLAELDKTIQEQSVSARSAPTEVPTSA